MREASRLHVAFGALPDGGPAIVKKASASSGLYLHESPRLRLAIIVEFHIEPAVFLLDAASTESEQLTIPIRPPN